MERKELIWSGSSSKLAAAMLMRALFIKLSMKVKDVEVLFCCVDVRRSEAWDEEKI
jgi:hypothetical protein